MTLALGKKPASPLSKKAIMFSDVFDATKMPTPPKMFGHQRLVSTWYVYGNDEYGDCVWAAKAHMHMLWSLMGGRPRARFTAADVLSDYSAATGFRASDPNTDQGTDMKDAAEYHRKIGVRDAKNVRHRVHAYTNLSPGNVDQLAVAAYVMGSVEIGVMMSDANMDEFDRGQPWEYTGGQIVGGHCVPVVGRDSNGNFLCVTWGRLQRITPRFLHTRMDEGIGYLDTEILNKAGLSPEAFDHKTLEAMLSKVSPQPLIASPDTAEVQPVGLMAAAEQVYPTVKQCDAAFHKLRDALDKAGYGWAISDAKLRPFTDDVAAAVVSAGEDT